jgi:hypothetical protein
MSNADYEWDPYDGDDVTRFRSPSPLDFSDIPDGNNGTRSNSPSPVSGLENMNSHTDDVTGNLSQSPMLNQQSSNQDTNNGTDVNTYVISDPRALVDLDICHGHLKETLDVLLNKDNQFTDHDLQVINKAADIAQECTTLADNIVPCVETITVQDTTSHSPAEPDPSLKQIEEYLMTIKRNHTLVDETITHQNTINPDIHRHCREMLDACTIFFQEFKLFIGKLDKQCELVLSLVASLYELVNVKKYTMPDILSTG